jgi:hypothetical protein
MSSTPHGLETEVAITGTVAAVGAGLSVAALGMKAGSDVAAGQAKKQEYGVKSADYLLESSAKATNYELQATSAATNYRYQGQQQEAQFDITSGQDLMQASHATTAAEFGDLQASMTDAAARRGVNQTLGNITTMRAAGGADLSSPTTAALEGNITGVSNLNRSAAVASINAQSAEERASAAYLKQASDFALTQGASARAMGEYNATTAETYGKYNADTTRAYGEYNAKAASSLGDTAATLGYLNAGTDILGGLGKMFGSGAGSGGG